MTSGLKPFSLRIVLADDRKPWADISSWVKPMRRKAELNAFSDSAFLYEIREGNMRSPNSDAGQISLNTSTACRERGTSCGRRIFRALGRDAPDGLIEIDLQARRSANPARTGKG